MSRKNRVPCPVSLLPSSPPGYPLKLPASVGNFGAVGWRCSWPACVAPAVMQMIRSERGFSHFCKSWILLGSGDGRRFVSKCVCAGTSRRAYCSLCSSWAGDGIKTPSPVCGVSGCSWDRPLGFPLWPEPWLGKSSPFFRPFGPFMAR